MKSNLSYDARVAPLPARTSRMTPKSLRGSAVAHGFDFDKAAGLYSRRDWMEDMIWLQSECRANELSAAQRDILVDRLRSRNEEIWGRHSRTDAWSVFEVDRAD